MAPRKRGNSGNSSNGATLGFERELWQAADTLRGSVDFVERKGCFHITRLTVSFPNFRGST